MTVNFLIKVLHAQLIFQLKGFPYDPIIHRPIPYVLTLIYLSKDPSVLDDSKIRSLILSISVILHGDSPCLH